jgi:hypothetical protein
VLGDLIDLAQNNSARWPVPQPAILGGVGGRPGVERRHYLRVSGEPHPGLDRRIESLVRRAGLAVQNRAVRGAGEQVHLGYVVSAGSAAAIDDVRQAIARLARVHAVQVLGVYE